MGKAAKKSAPKVAPVEVKAGLGGTTFGGFQDPGYISIEDEYVKRTDIPTRHCGSNIIAIPAKKGKTTDVYFDKDYKRLEDKFHDPGKSEQEKKQAEVAKKLVISGPWKHTSPGKKSSGCGTYMGTFQERNPVLHEQEYDIIKKGDKPEPPKRQPPNIGSFHPKTGGFGMTGQGIYFSAPEPLKDSKPDPYDGQRQKEKEDYLINKKKQIGFANGTKPFRSAGRVCLYTSHARRIISHKTITTKKTDEEHI